LFKGRVLMDAGPMIGTGTNIFARLRCLYYKYRSLYYDHRKRFGFDQADVHIEQLPRQCHHYTHWSVGVIGVAFEDDNILADLPVQSWQKYAEWKGERLPLKPYLESVSTDDELAAIGMGLWYLNNKG